MYLDKAKKEEIIQTHGWDSPEMTAWREEEKTLGKHTGFFCWP